MDSLINRVVAGPAPEGHRVTFARLGASESVELPELRAMAGNVAQGLRRLGVRPGDRIGILSANRLEWVLLDLAALRLKVVTAGLEPGKFDPRPELLERYGLSALFTDQPISREDGETHKGILPIEDVRALAQPSPGDAPLPDVSYDPGEATTLKFTSGSTGRPKGLAATAGSIDSSLRAVQGMFAHGPGDDIFVFLPLSLLQQRYWIYSALCFGHDVTVSTYEAAFAVMPSVRPTVVMGVPGFFETAMRHVRETGGEPRELFGDRVRYLWTGSAPARAEMLRFFNEAGVPIYEGYGLNETCIVTKNHPGASREGSVGRVVPGKHVVLDEDGVIHVRSDHPVARRYEYCAPGESEAIFLPDGTVRTGDVGHLDEDGFLFVHGRADDAIVLDNGRNVIVRPIEERMRAEPAIAECVVFCPDQTRLVAVVSPAGTGADEAAISARLAAVNAGLEPDERISRVIVADPPFSIGNGLLTSQYKPRRQRILDAYRHELSTRERGIHAR
ncbi:AMP-binding protein [Actinomadura yumaensis]|uniref:AMP-binding protein n=1 Tax=Actinomadura yumaensis TaxID=111807 RepID=A0ABW2CGV3_9ACTN